MANDSPDETAEKDRGEQVAEAAGGLEPLKPRGENAVRYAYAYLTLLILLPLVGLAVGVYLDLIALNVTVSVEAALGQAVEWLTLGLVVAFLLWTFVQIVRVTGIGFISSLIGAVARAADNYELPQEDDEQ